MRLVIEYGTGGSVRGVTGHPGFRAPAIGKTGTTDRERDLWFVGGSPTYTGALWVGYDKPATVGASASDTAAPLWGWWFRALHSDLPTEDFTDPDLNTRSFCTISGKRGNGSCRLIWGPFVPGTEPSEACEISHASEETPERRVRLWDSTEE